MNLRPHGLRKRLAWFLLLPVALLVFAIGAVGYVYTRRVLLEFWSAAAIAKLERAAHTIDVRLRRPREVMSILGSTDLRAIAESTRRLLVDQLSQVYGVVAVRADWPDIEPPPAAGNMSAMDGMARRADSLGISWDMMHFMKTNKMQISSPRFDAELNHETVTIRSRFTAGDNTVKGGIEVVMSFPALTRDIISTRWSRHLTVLLVDNNGVILSSSNPDGRYAARAVLGRGGTELERRTLAAIGAGKSGTLLGKGRPPAQVSGYYQLQEVPWTLVVIAPGREVLYPVIEFREYFLAMGAVASLLVVLLIFVASGPTVRGIRRVSAAARKIADGDFSVRLPPLKSNDEVADLVADFNIMAGQLEEGVRVKQGLRLAMEVQRHFLPTDPVRLPGLEAAGVCLYCDETGGDFFDYPECGGADNRFAVVVGDVVGHGIGAALLMATCRASLRSLAAQGMPVDRVVAEVNRLVCRDTRFSGSFITLFFLVADLDTHTITWVRAGHDPAFVYDTATGVVHELKGPGVALGVDDGLEFCANTFAGSAGELVVFIGTDGVWEMENAAGEPFGRRRVEQLLRECHAQGAVEIGETLTRRIADFQGEAPQLDDITFVVLKTGPRAGAGEEG